MYREAAATSDRPGARPAPSISVVICTHNRAAYLRTAIASVFAQDFPRENFELLVVDNRSTDETRAVCDEFAAAENFRYVYESTLGLCYARNCGWRNARGRYVAYLDDDAIAEPGWLAVIEKAFAWEDPEPGIVGGKVNPIWEAERPKWISDGIALGLTIVDWSDRPMRIPDVRVHWLVGANMAVPAAVLRAVGGFEPALDRIGNKLLTGGDVFLQHQILERGYVCFYHPGMAVRHLVPRSRLQKGWFLRRYYWQGISDAVAEVIVDRHSWGRRLGSAIQRTGRLLAKPRRLIELVLPTDDPRRFEQRCFTLIEVGHIAGLLGAGGR
jgi:glycosyltransferase involved in cell wall biosynthesis